MATSSQINDSADEKLSLALLNINGLRNKIDKIQNIIKRCKVHVVALCETKLDASVKARDIYIPGFRIWRRDRRNNRTKSGGGVALYVQDHIETRLRLDLMEDEVEVIWVEMKVPEGRPVLLGCCYRRPDNNVQYLLDINRMMTEVVKEKEEKDILLMGDLNIKWGAKNSLMTNIAVHVLSNLGLTQIVKVKTKFAKKSSSCIDHIYTNIPDLCSEPKSIEMDCSDHRLVTFKVEKKIPKMILRSKVNPISFMGSVEKAPWTDVNEKSDPQEALDKFTEMYLSVANEHAPLMVQDIYESLKSRKKIETFLSQTAEAEEDVVNSNQTNNGSLSEGGEGKAKLRPRCTKSFQVSVKSFEILLRSQVITITQNRALTSEEAHLENIPPTNTGAAGPESGLEGPSVQQRKKRRKDGFRLEETDPETVKGWWMRLCDDVIQRIDETEAELMKRAADFISAPVCHIINRCISTGKIPDELKKFKTFPFLRHNLIHSRLNNSADRVHIMLGFIFDRILYEQVEQFFTTENLIPSGTLQEEIRRMETVWLAASGAQQTFRAVLLDFSSAFNTGTFDRLIDKLSRSGFSDLSLIKNFLSYCEGSSDLPQGSFLAQLVFIASIHDLKMKFQTSSVIIRSRYMMMIYVDGDSLTVKTKLDDVMNSVRSFAEQFNISTDKTRAEIITFSQKSDINYLAKFLKYHKT